MPTFRAISLWQPWASAMSEGAKRNETRSWKTGYRGDLVIHAAKRKPTRAEAGDDYEAALKFPYGAALCIVEVYDCVPTANFIRSADTAKLPLRTITAQEWSLGNYEPGRYAWLTRNLRKLKEPLPIIGRQGFFTVEIPAHLIP